MSKATHSFSVEIAAIEGLVEAILLQHIHFLQTNFTDGAKDVESVWVRRSVKAYRITYPYLTDKQIRGALDRLESRGVVASKIENSASYDRTKSFQLTEKGWFYFRANAFAERANGNDETANGFSQKGESYIGSYNNVIISYNKEEEESAQNANENFQHSGQKEKINPPVAPAPPDKKESQAAAYSTTFDIDRAAADMTTDYRCIERFMREFKCSEEKAKEAHPRAVAEFVEDQKAVKSVYHADRQFRAHYFAWLPKRAAAKRAEKEKQNTSTTATTSQYRRLTTDETFIPKNIPVFR